MTDRNKPQPKPRPDDVVSHTDPTPEADILKYWTEERQRQAQPVPMPHPPKPDDQSRKKGC
jgi:hypothetical protein